MGGRLRFRLGILIFVSTYCLVIILAGSNPVPVFEEKYLKDKEFKKKGKDINDDYVILDAREVIDDEEMLEELSIASQEDIEAIMNTSPFLQQALKSKVKHALKSRKKMDKVLKKIAKLQEEQDELFEKKDAKVAELKDKMVEKVIEKKFKLEKLKEKLKEKFNKYIKHSNEAD